MRERPLRATHPDSPQSQGAERSPPRRPPRATHSDAPQHQSLELLGGWRRERAVCIQPLLSFSPLSQGWERKDKEETRRMVIVVEGKGQWCEKKIRPRVFELQHRFPRSRSHDLTHQVHAQFGRRAYIIFSTACRTHTVTQKTVRMFRIFGLCQQYLSNYPTKRYVKHTM